MARISKCKEVERIVNNAVKSGAWSIVWAGGSKHDKLKHTSGHTIPIPGSPSDPRSSLNFRTHLRHIERGVATC